MEYVLEMKDISKTFPGVKAVDHVQLQVKPGEVHALMGDGADPPPDPGSEADYGDSVRRQQFSYRYCSLLYGRKSG